VARSRYSNTPVIDGFYYGTWSNPVSRRLDGDLLEGVETFEHVVELGERLDSLSARFFGDDQYWWVIALVNDIGWAHSITPGAKLRVPRDVRRILDKLLR
jgi:nucleoid-associated protein YgaU